MATLCFAGISRQAHRQEVTLTVANPYGTDGPQKFENGLEIFWRDTGSRGDPNPDDEDPEATIEIFDDSAHELAICHVAPAIREADPTFTGVSIWDVSARKPGYIAVGAVYTRAHGSNVPLLLYFNWDGTLLRRNVLNETSEIQSLEIDSSSHVWTLNDFSPENPIKYVFSEYDSAGSMTKGVLKPRAEWSTNEGTLAGGQTPLA